MQSLEAVLAFFLLLTGNAITYPADTSVTLPFPVENSVPYMTAESSQDSDIQECLNRSEKFCSCYVVNKSVICCNATNVSRLCIDDHDVDDDAEVVEPILHVSIVLSPLRRLTLTAEVWTKMGVKDISRVRQVRVSNTKINNLTICRNKFDSPIPRPRPEPPFDRPRRFVTSPPDDHGYYTTEAMDLDKWAAEFKELHYCEDFVQLEHLDIRNNSLKQVREMKLPSLKKIHISGNQWSCFPGNGVRQLASDNEMEWILEHKKSVADSGAALCMRPPSKKWHQHSNGKTNVTLVHFLEFNKDVETKCPDNCSCYIININDPLWVKVTCSELNLTKLPDSLPPNTQVLNVSYNMIQSLTPLRTNPHYNKLKQLIAPDNEISSLDDLIGSPFVNNKPTTLNLQLNRITSFNVDLLRSMLSKIDTHHDSVNFLFAYNPWDCSCNRVKTIQNFIYEFKLWLRDSEHLACGIDESPNLVSFDYNSMCAVDTGVDYMAILVVFEVVLLAVILTKLSYDVWQYRDQCYKTFLPRTGELPWLARHICLGYNYSNINKTNGGSRNQNDWKRTVGSSGVGGPTADDDAVQFVGDGSDSPTSEGSESAGHVRCLTYCFKCVSGHFDRGSSSQNLDKSSNKSNRDVVMFRPRRQTENSANNSNGSGSHHHKSSPTSISAVTLRKTSRMGPNSPKKSPTQSKASTNALRLLPVNLLQTNRDKVLEAPDDDLDREKQMKILFYRGLKGSTSEDRLSFRTVMEPLPMIHSRTFSGPDNRFMNGLNKSRIKRNISRSTSTLQNSVAL